MSSKYPVRSLLRPIGILSVVGSLFYAAPVAAQTNPPQQCIGRTGPPSVAFNPATDLNALLLRIAHLSNDPSLLYGPGPWTNWYRESDQRDALAKLAVSRGLSDASALWNIYRGWFPPSSSCSSNDLAARTADGTCNDPRVPAMGAAGTRFSRVTFPYAPSAQRDDASLMTPNPRSVSRRLFTRKTFQPIPFLNLLAAAWIQFQIHDWFNHTNSTRAFHRIPLERNDPLARDRRGRRRRHMLVAKTAPDPSRQSFEAGLAPTALNEVTHWWDGSQVYGSDHATAQRLRAGTGGQLRVDSNGRIPVAADGFDDVGLRVNWWLGLGLMHDLFAKEHNAIADHLAAAYPTWTDQQLYDKARLINAALMARIHTVEWTPAILPNPTLDIAMNTNWRGLNQYFVPPFPGLPPGVPAEFEPILFGIVGGQRDLKVDPLSGQPVAFQLPEEFVSVYRMHNLLPDRIRVRHVPGQRRQGTGPRLRLAALREASGRRLQERLGEANLLYTFGVEHPGALVLNNYPRLLQDVPIPYVGRTDLGAVDILRDRERGVARYNTFRRQLLLPPVPNIDALTPNPRQRAALKSVYGSDAQAIERVDLLVGVLAEAERPDCYGFGETLFTLFTAIASRRLQADRFYTDDYRPEVYTPEGLAWIESNSLKSVLLRHYPSLANTGLSSVDNAFYPWR